MKNLDTTNTVLGLILVALALWLIIIPGAILLRPLF